MMAHEWQKMGKNDKNGAWTIMNAHDDGKMMKAAYKIRGATPQWSIYTYSQAQAEHSWTHAEPYSQITLAVLVVTGSLDA